MEGSRDFLEMQEQEKRKGKTQAEPADSQIGTAKENAYAESEDRNGIDMERFGSFVAVRRKEQGLTQKALAEKLYISNKAVSKWERGLSLPDIALLEPLAGALGVTVTELLHGEKGKEGEHEERELSWTEIERLMQVSPARSETEKEQQRAVRRKRRAWYFIGVFLSAAEMGLLFAFRDFLGISLFNVAMDMLLVNPLILFLGIWPFLIMPDQLPPIYDRTPISVYSDGFFRLQIAGVYFNNRNWPHITRALRRFCFLMPVCWPILYLLVSWVVPDHIWRFGRIFAEMAIILGGLFIPVVVTAKKYGGN